MKHIKIVLLGLDFQSENLGCEALSFSFLNILERIAENNDLFFDCISVNYHSFEYHSKYVSLKSIVTCFKSISFFANYASTVKQVDFVIDFTGGDSFSDMYGISRFLKESSLKVLALLSKTPLIFGPQTIGPFKNKIIKALASYIMNNSHQVFVRDKLSYDYAKSMNIDSILVTDIAFCLSYDTQNVQLPINDNFKIGININALMWSGGYSGKNDFGLQLNYSEYIVNLIKELLKKEYSVYLIPHVLANNRIEDDYYINCQIYEKINDPNLYLSPKFRTPNEAKKYISSMDFFIGSRMHATVAAFSTNIPFIAVSYSRKFQGLYDSLGYRYIIDGKKTSTKLALKQTQYYIDSISQIEEDLKRSVQNAKKYTSYFIDQLSEILLNLKNR